MKLTLYSEMYFFRNALYSYSEMQRNVSIYKYIEIHHFRIKITVSLQSYNEVYVFTLKRKSIRTK